MAAKPRVSALRAVLQTSCPRCRLGKIYPSSIFRGFPKMNDRCAVCHLGFEREEGYFLGAMIVDYSLAMVMTTIIAIILWSFTRWSFEKLCVVAILIFLPAVPTVTRLGRVLWISFDQLIDPQR
ncbi:MAG TPA: DUF983 domain-containing protein [Candidatus Acidoferrales bacterium]|nr:DUF983 domain-containing protein [Candidatus Acidoferrales bacterium]